MGPITVNPQRTKATHQQTKAYNGQLVLRTIFDCGAISRAEVARRTGLTRVTVSEIAGDLLERGLVAEVGRGPSTGGKSPILLSVVDDARHVIGVDLASYEFRGAVVNLRCQIRRALKFPLFGRTGDEAVALVFELIDALRSATEQPILGIGIGTPGLVDTQQGVVRQAVNLEWRDLRLAALLEDRYGLPVYVANDSQVAALAEHTFGAGRADHNLVVIKAGRGIGAGTILNGHLFQGDHSAAGEIGHVVVVEDGQPCRCGKSGCLETVASSEALLRQARLLAQTTEHTFFSSFAADPNEITSDVIVQALNMDDAAAVALVSAAATALGRAIAFIVGILNVRRILLVGTLTHFGPPWFEAVRAAIQCHSMPALATDIDVSLGQLDENVVTLGASALLLTNELGLDLAR